MLGFLVNLFYRASSSIRNQQMIRWLVFGHVYEIRSLLKDKIFKLQIFNSFLTNRLIASRMNIQQTIDVRRFGILLIFQSLSSQLKLCSKQAILLVRIS